MRGAWNSASILAMIMTVGGIWMSACQQGSKSVVPLSRKQIQSLLSTTTLPVAIVADPGEIEDILTDLHPWVDVKKLRRPAQKSFVEFCRFLAVRRRCDDTIDAKKMADQEAVQATQPLLDDLAKLGEPTEDVLIHLLEARISLGQLQRRQTLCSESPEIYAAIVLWKMKSSRAVPLFMELAKNKEIENRAVFVRGLGRIGDPKALDLLKELAGQDNPAEIQSEAGEAIKTIQGDAAPDKK